MESVIKWRTGMPKEAGRYLVTLEDGTISIDNLIDSTTHRINGVTWFYYDDGYVTAWCPMSEIEPYKE